MTVCYRDLTPGPTLHVECKAGGHQVPFVYGSLLWKEPSQGICIQASQSEGRHSNRKTTEILFVWLGCKLSLLTILPYCHIAIFFLYSNADNILFAPPSVYLFRTNSSQHVKNNAKNSIQNIKRKVPGGGKKPKGLMRSLYLL